VTIDAINAVNDFGETLVRTSDAARNVKNPYGRNRQRHGAAKKPGYDSTRLRLLVWRMRMIAL
jgi:hypothetical protein